MINGIDYLRKMYPNRDEKDYQPNGLDLRIGKLYTMKYEDDQFYGIIDNVKSLPSLEEVSTILFKNPEDKSSGEGSEVFKLRSNVPYIAEVENQIQIGDSNAQFYFPRSSLIRAGINVYTSVGDSGYNGHLQFLIINHSPVPFYLSKGERFAQLVDLKAKGISEHYDGDYQEKLI